LHRNGNVYRGYVYRERVDQGGVYQRERIWEREDIGRSEGIADCDCIWHGSRGWVQTRKVKVLNI